jgi:hypothetical protein
MKSWEAGRGVWDERKKIRGLGASREGLNEGGMVGRQVRSEGWEAGNKGWEAEKESQRL